MPTAVAAGFEDGDAREPLNELVAVVYEELRAIARRQLARAGAGTLTTTGVVHEAYLKLAGRRGAQWRDRAHFLALCAVAMRHVLVDRARAQATLKRGEAVRPMTLEEQMIPADDQSEALLQLDAALDRLAKVAPRLAKVVEMRFFGGLTVEEIAEIFGVDTRTIERDWVKARILLRAELE